MRTVVVEIFSPAEPAEDDPFKWSDEFHAVHVVSVPEDATYQQIREAILEKHSGLGDETEVYLQEIANPEILEIPKPKKKGKQR